MNDIGEKGWSRVSAQMVLGRGEERGPASYRVVMSLGLCSQGVRWKPCIEGGLAPAGHIVSYSVQQSFLRYGDGSLFLWLSSGKGISLHQGHTGRNIELAKKFVWGWKTWMNFLANPIHMLLHFGITFSSTRCWLYTCHLGSESSWGGRLVPARLPHPHPPTITWSHWFTKGKRNQQVLVSESTACQNVENAVKVLRGKIIAINTY